MMKIFTEYTSCNRSIHFQHAVNFKDVTPLINKAESHSRYEICYVEKGNAEYAVDGVSYTISQGDLAVINVRKMHKLHSALNTDFDRYTLQFSPMIISTKALFGYPHENEANNVFAPLLLNNNAQIVIFRKSEVETTKITPLLSRLENLCGDKDKTQLINIISVILEISSQIHLMHERNIYQVAHQSNEHLKRVMDYIDKHLFTNLNLSVIAKELYLSPYYISHLFSKHMGVSIKKYINTKKILYAEQLIQLGYPPTEVAMRIGYSYYSTFFNTYKQIIGKSPSETK